MAPNNGMKFVAQEKRRRLTFVTLSSIPLNTMATHGLVLLRHY